MTEAALRLKEQLLRLPEDDREELADLLWDSLDDCTREEAANEWAHEILRRVHEIETGQEVGEPYQKVIAELREEADREREHNLP